MSPAEAEFWIRVSREPAAVVLTAAVAVLYPFLGYRRFLRLQRLPDPLPTPQKLRLYLTIVVSQWVLVAATALVLARSGGSLLDLGQRIPSLPLVAGTTLVLVIAFAALSRLTLRQLAQAGDSDLPGHVRRAGKILPWTGVERGGFTAVAVTAGVCEEILYRGWLPWFLFGWTGSLWLSFALAAVVFGLGHAYQGRGGVIMTGALGLLLGGVVLATRSLVPGQVLHVVIDLVNGFAVGGAMQRIASDSVAVAASAAADAADASAAADAADAAGAGVDAPPGGAA